VKRCDLVVTSLSPRAIDNLTITHGDLKEVNPSLRTLAVTAFAAGSPEADWIAYGPGVHAALGLGWDGARHHAPALSYPDPLAGLMAASVAVDQLTGIAGADERVSLAEAAAPLAAEKPPFELTDTAVLNEMWRGQPSDGLRHLLELS
jgi:crotonobetainyl-CoA:carnitine CoA-transferase CaiB-like acyl-CoA transferase